MTPMTDRFNLKVPNSERKLFAAVDVDRASGSPYLYIMGHHIRQG